MTLLIPNSDWPSLRRRYMEHDLWLSFAARFQEREYSALQHSPSQSPATAPVIALPTLGSWPSTILHSTCLYLPVLQSRELVSEGAMLSIAEQASRCFRLNPSRETLAFPSRLSIPARHIRLDYHFESFGSFKKSRPRRDSPFSSKFVQCHLLITHRLLDVNVVDGAQRSPIFNVFAQCSLSSFVQSQRLGRLNLIHNDSHFHVVSTCTGTCFRRVFRFFRFCSVVRKYIVPLMTEIGRFMITFSSVHPVAGNSSSWYIY